MKKNTLEAILVSICKKSWKETFVTDVNTQRYLLLCTLLIWGAGVFLHSNDIINTFYIEKIIIFPESSLILSIAALLMYMIAAPILSSIKHLEHGVEWLSGIFLFFSSLLFPLHIHPLWALTTLIIVIEMKLLFSAFGRKELILNYFVSIALPSFSSILFPELLFTLPLFFLFPFIVGIYTMRLFLSGLLAFISPFWLLFTLTYAFPELNFLWLPLKNLNIEFQFISLEQLSPLLLLLMFIALSIMFPCVIHLLSSRSLGKPILRSFLIYIIIFNASIWIVTCFQIKYFYLFYSWQLPGLSFMISYMFAQTKGKEFDIYFIYIFSLLFLFLILEVWIG